MTDLVERLRAHHETPSVIRSHPTICDEAADEIERLRAALQEIADNEDDEWAAATIARRALEPKAQGGKDSDHAL